MRGNPTARTATVEDPHGPHGDAVESVASFAGGRGSAAGPAVREGAAGVGLMAVPCAAEVARAGGTVLPRSAAFVLGRVRSRRKRGLLRFGMDVTWGVLAVLAINLFVVQVSIVRGKSMEPFLHDGDRLIVDRLITPLRGVDRFDVVVMRSPTQKDVDYVKRVVGLPGDRVALRRGVLWINGRPVDEPFAHEADQATTSTWTIPEDHVFVLGDHRGISADSREFGSVSNELLRGKVWARVWPLDRFGFWP